jgi:hypothetical protein
MGELDMWEVYINLLAPELSAAKDQNFSDICRRKAMKCYQLNLMSGVLSIILCGVYT